MFGRRSAPALALPVLPLPARPQSLAEVAIELDQAWARLQSARSDAEYAAAYSQIETLQNRTSH